MATSFFEHVTRAALRRPGGVREVQATTTEGEHESRRGTRAELLLERAPRRSSG